MQRSLDRGSGFYSTEIEDPESKLSLKNVNSARRGGYCSHRSCPGFSIFHDAKKWSNDIQASLNRRRCCLIASLSYVQTYYCNPCSNILCQCGELFTWHTKKYMSSPFIRLDIIGRWLPTKVVSANFGAVWSASEKKVWDESEISRMM